MAKSAMRQHCVRYWNSVYKPQSFLQHKLGFKNVLTFGIGRSFVKDSFRIYKSTAEGPGEIISIHITSELQITRSGGGGGGGYACYTKWHCTARITQAQLHDSSVSKHLDIMALHMVPLLHKFS